jgi:hypothetical protein
MAKEYIMKTYKKKSILQPLFAAGLILSLGQSYAYAAEVISANEEDQALQQKVKARLLEIEAEARTADLEKNGYYVERKSYGTGRETDPPRYVKQANKTWLKNYDAFENLDWLDIGLDYRIRIENRDNDYRRTTRDENPAVSSNNRKPISTIDEPILLRTRAYVAIKDILDPLRFTIEVEDAQRNNSQFTRSFDTRDVNKAEPIQAYLELYFKNSILGKDDLGNDRPISIKAGRQAFEYLDRRLFARNEWRNTTNNHQGIRATFGQKKNDWQLDLLALKPVQRFTEQLDEVNHSQDIYGAIFDWRRWSDVVTLQPYYYVFKQDGDKVKFNTNGFTESPQNKIDRTIHTAGLRAFGVIAKSGFDYDANYVKQWGDQDKRNNSGDLLDNLDHDAYSYNAEIGYSPKHSWKPRFSAFYGFASGDKNPNDGKNQRFDAPFGFARPWSNNDYFDMANIRAPKVRVEFEPQLSWLESLKVDAGFSWYRLDSDTDRWRGGDLQYKSGKNGGKDVGKEFDVRVRFPINQYVSANLGYAHFWAGDFTKTETEKADPNRKDNSDFLYAEFSISAF